VNRRRVAVDLGNTRVKCWGPKRIGAQAPLRFESALHGDGWLEALLAWRAAPFFSDSSGDLHRPATADASVEWLVASVNRQTAALIRKQIELRFTSDVWHELKSTDVPIKTSLHAPDAVGVDRLLAAWGAWTKLQTAVVIADAGSALTVDWVDASGTFQGGAILPGIEMQLQALADHTPALQGAVRQVAAEHAAGALQAPGYPGTDTVAAIATGVYTSVAATIEAFTTRVRQTCDAEVPLWLTGGDAARISQGVRVPHAVDSRLVEEAIWAVIASKSLP